jgi:hypothetical protein
MDKYREAAKLLNLVQKAGARHSAKDMSMVQEMHDRACELGAKCNCETPTHPMLKGALVERHGTHNQKTHGHRHGVGGLREFAKGRGYQVRQFKDKTGKTQISISNERGDKMRAGGLTEARKLITSARKFDRAHAKRREQRVTSEAEAVLSRTKKQRAADVTKLSKRPLSELRKWQDLTEKQIGMAHKQGNTRAMEALQARQNDLMAAVMSKLK